MTQPTPEGTQSGAEDLAQSGGPEDGDGATGSTGDGGEAGTQGGGRTYTQAEYDAMREQMAARMRAADQNKSRAEAALQQLRDKDLPEMEKLKRDLEANAKRAEEAERGLRESRMQNAFLTNTKYEWQNPKAALRLLDMSKIDFDADGTVTGMDDAIEALAKSDPYLLKPKAEAKDQTPTDNKPGTIPGTNGGQRPPTGVSKMVGRIPALGGRVPKSN